MTNYEKSFFCYSKYIKHILFCNLKHFSEPFKIKKIVTEFSVYCYKNLQVL